MLIKTGLAVSQMSGTMGGVVASHNRYGQYFRAWRKPTDPQSEGQRVSRDAMAFCVAAWKELSDADRDTWNIYAANTPWLNRLGETVYLSGMQWFVRFNAFSYQVNVLSGNEPEVTEDCGSTGGLPEGMNAMVATVGVAAGLSLAYDDTQTWANAVGNLAIIGMSKPRPATRIYGKGPYKLFSAIVGAAVPTGSPHVVATAGLPYAIAVGDRVDFSVRIVMANATMSEPTVASAIVGA